MRRGAAAGRCLGDELDELSALLGVNIVGSPLVGLTSRSCVPSVIWRLDKLAESVVVDFLVAERNNQRAVGTAQSVSIGI